MFSIKDILIKKEFIDTKSIEERESDKRKLAFINEFNETMYELGLYNKFNKTYRLDIIEEKNYGYIADIYLARGLNFNDLEKHQNTIQQNLNCLLVLNYQNNSNKASIKIITQAIDTTINYFSPDIKANEIYLGMSYSLESIVSDCNKYCMFLLAGAIGTGKTRFIYTILLSWILSRESKNIELYIADIAKREFVCFQDAKIVRGYADDLEELREMAKYLKLKIAYRTNIIEPYRKKGVATNIEEYNKIPGIDTMTYNYLLIDEFSTVMPHESDTAQEKAIKEEILSDLKRISKLGRSMGIFVFMCTQKVTKDEIPAIIKNMSAVRISFRANDDISSQVIMGDNSAEGLADRIAVYSLNGGSKKDYLFSPNLSTSALNNLLRPHLNDKFPKLNLKLMIKEMEQVEEERIKVKEGNTSSEKFIGNNEIQVSKDLPYDIILHDQSKVKEDKKIDFSKTEKTRKKAVKVKNGWWMIE